MVTTTGTVIQNGCCYKATKVIKNGAEILLGGGGDTWPKYAYVEFLIVGGGGGAYGAGGGGGGGFVECSRHQMVRTKENPNPSCNIVVGAGGSGLNGTGGNSCFGTIVAYGGGGGGNGYTNYGPGKAGGSGGGGYSYDCCVYSGGNCCPGQGNRGGNGTCYGGSGGGGGAGSAGCNGIYSSKGGDGGIGKQSSITGATCWYSGGGAGARTRYGDQCYGTSGLGYDGCGGGGVGTCYSSGTVGKCGIVVVRYLTDGSSGIKCATGGCVYTCGDYTIHCFTSNGTFCIQE